MICAGSRGRIAALVLTSFALASCGGGSSGGGDPPPSLSGTARLEATFDVLVEASVSAQWNGPAGSSPQCVLTSGSLPPGMTLSSSCVLSGAPTQTGTFAPRVTLTANGFSGSLTVDGNLTVVGPTLGPPNSPAGTGLVAGTTVTDLPLVGVSYVAPFSARAGDVLNYRVVSGTLPAGLTLDASTGQVSGTAAQQESQTFAVGATLSRGSGSYALAPYSVTLDIGAAPVDLRGEGVYFADFQDGFGGWAVVRPDGTIWWVGGSLVPSSQGPGAGTRFVPASFFSGKASPAAGLIPTFSVLGFGTNQLAATAFTVSGRYDAMTSDTLSLDLAATRTMFRPSLSSYRYDTSPAPLSSGTFQVLWPGQFPAFATVTFNEDGTIRGTVYGFVASDSSQTCSIMGFHRTTSGRNLYDVRLTLSCFGSPASGFAGVAWVNRYVYEGNSVDQVLMPLVGSTGTQGLMLVSP